MFCNFQLFITKAYLDVSIGMLSRSDVKVAQFALASDPGDAFEMSPVTCCCDIIIRI